MNIVTEVKVDETGIIKQMEAEKKQEISTEMRCINCECCYPDRKRLQL